MKNKFKSYSFWLSVAGAVGLSINNFGKFFGFSFDSQVLTEVVDSVCGVLILFGIITISKPNKNKDEQASEHSGENAEDMEGVSNCKNGQSSDGKSDDKKHSLDEKEKKVSDENAVEKQPDETAKKS